MSEFPMTFIEKKQRQFYCNLLTKVAASIVAILLAHSDNLVLKLTTLLQGCHKLMQNVTAIPLIGWEESGRYGA